MYIFKLYLNTPNVFSLKVWWLKLSKNFELTLIRLKPNQLDQLKKRKKNIGITVAEQIRIAVYHYLRNENWG